MSEGFFASVVVISNRPLDVSSELLRDLAEQDSSYKVEIIFIHELEFTADEQEALPEGVRESKVSAGRGCGYNRNRGIEEARGDAVIFIDDDCVPARDWIDQVVTPIARGEVSAVVGGAMVDARTFLGRAIAGLGFPGGGSVGFPHIFSVDESSYTTSLVTCSSALSRTALDDVGAFDETMTYGEDTELGMRLILGGHKILYNPRAQVGHPPREQLKGWASHQLLRGRAKRQVARRQKISGLVKGRLGSDLYVLRHSWSERTFVLVAPLLMLSYVAQLVGLVRESLSSSSRPS